MLINRHFVCKRGAVLLFLGLLIGVWIIQRKQSVRFSRQSTLYELTDGNRMASSKPTYNEVVNSWIKHNDQRSSQMSTDIHNSRFGGYIICNTLAGQQASSILALLSLQCWAKSFSLQMKMVEPFVEGQTRTSLPRRKSPETSSKLSDFIDIHHFNNVSAQRGEIPLVSWREFASVAPKLAIVVRVESGCNRNATNCMVDIRRYNTAGTWRTQQVNGSNCFNEDYLENWLLTRLDLCIVRIVHLLCFKSDEDYRRMYSDIFDDLDPRNVTLVVQHWMASYKHHNPDSSHSIQCGNSDAKRQLSDKIVMSERLRSDVSRYTERFLHSQRYIAVMIRSEKVVLSTRGRVDSVVKLEQCIEKTLNVVHRIQKSQNISKEDTLLTVDVGKFGTVAKKWLSLYLNNTSRNKALEAVKNIVPAVCGDKLSFSDWESSFTQTSQSMNIGYIGALQRELASQADCLVLMGGGNFQQMAYQGYLENHKHNNNSHCIQVVCATISASNDSQQI